MRYYHDPVKRSVYEEPEPWAEEKRGACEVGVTVKVTSSTNCRMPGGGWAQGWSILHTETYAHPKAEAMNIFRDMHMGDWGQEITREEFERLARQYKAEAEANVPPEGGSSAPTRPGK